MDGRGSDRAPVLQVEELGETQITEEVFQDYLRTQGGDRFRGDRYDLFRHNCNNFSHETAQFLVGRGIPQHIVDLPGEILATPMGQMLAPMLQQMAPSGTSIPFTNNPAAPGPAPPPPSSSASSTKQSAVRCVRCQAACEGVHHIRPTTQDRRVIQETRRIYHKAT